MGDVRRANRKTSQIAAFLILVLVMLAAAPRSFAQTNCIEAGGVCFTPPEGYAEREVTTQGGIAFHALIKLGGHTALNRELPTHRFDNTYIESWLAGDAYRMLKVAVIELPANDQAQPMSQLAARFHKGFASRWGQYAFAVFDAEKQIGHSINPMGAFIGGHVARCGSRFVIVEAMDAVEFLKRNNSGYDGLITGDDAARWQAARPIANTDDAEQLIANICKVAG